MNGSSGLWAPSRSRIPTPRLAGYYNASRHNATPNPENWRGFRADGWGGPEGMPGSGGGGGGSGGFGLTGGLRIFMGGCSFLMVAIGDWLAVDGWRLMVDGGLGIGVSGRLDSGCRSYGQGYFACRFRVLVFHAPAHCWTGIERWERPRRGLTHPRGIERSACRIRRWLQYRRFWPCCPEPGFLR